MALTERDYDLLSLYIDDALTPPERRAIESRLASDAEFRAELDALRRTIELVKSLPEMVAPRDLRLTLQIAAEVLAELKAAQPPKRRSSVVYRLTTIASAAASLVLVLAGALMLLQPERSSSSLPPGGAETVAVADAMLTEAPSTEIRALDTDEAIPTIGFIIPSGTVQPYATGGFGGAIDPSADTAFMQEAGTGEPDAAFAVPAPVIAGSSEATDTLMEEMEAPDDMADMPGSVSSPAPTATLAEAAGSSSRAIATATEDAANRTFAVVPPTPSALPSDEGLAEMSMIPTETSDDAVEQTMAQGTHESAPITETSSPILGFALIIMGIVLGVVALIMVVRTG